VTLCHANQSAGDPYVELSVPVKQIFEANGTTHTPHDIIPRSTTSPTTATSSAIPVKNWDAKAGDLDERL
jgi:hypothetical protein